MGLGGGNGVIILAGVLGGAAWGAWLAGQRGGRGADRLQYAAGFGTAFGLLAFFLTILIERLA